MSATRDLAFILAGNGDLYEQIRVKAKSLPNVYLPGWLNRDEIDALLMRSSIGICPTPMQVDLFPNKAFMYISAGLPVVSSFQGDLKALVESEKIGFYFAPGAVDKLADAVVALSSNPNIYKEMSGNAKRVFELKFNEDKIYQDFADHVERIESGSWA
jgi:glycosyltransferase involved in cell wall biosynthesis